jgi:hypothetical protein
MAVYAPLWKDTYFETGFYDVLNYSVRTQPDTGTTEYVIYKGKAYRQPSPYNSIQIKLNPIVDKYLGNQIDGTYGGWYPNGSVPYVLQNYTMPFYLFDDDTDTLLESYNFRYTYDETFVWHNMTYEEACEYDPLYYGSMTEDQYYTYFGDDGAVLGRDSEKQDSYKRRINGRWAVGQFQFLTFIQTTMWVNQFRNSIIRQTSSEYATACGDYAVYYLGKCGCWNDFLFEGACKREDSFNHYDYGSDGYNALTGNPEYSATIRRYCNEQTIRFECTTGWLTDKESENFAQDFMPACVVMLHELKTDKVYPVVIDDTSVETKKYKNNKQLNQYTVTFRVARDYYVR